MTIMGLRDVLAADVDEYVEMAVRLGSDPELRRTVSARIRQNKHKAFGDMEAVRGLENFISRVVEQGR